MFSGVSLQRFKSRIQFFSFLSSFFFLKIFIVSFLCDWLILTLIHVYDVPKYIHIQWLAGFVMVVSTVVLKLLFVLGCKDPGIAKRIREKPSTASGSFQQWVWNDQGDVF
jgi:cytochrome c biogenesis protein CcdA